MELGCKSQIQVWWTRRLSVFFGYCATNAVTFKHLCAFYLYRDEVRAPIPQKQEILVEPEPLFGGK